MSASKLFIDLWQRMKAGQTMQKPTCCQFHNTGGSKLLRCGPKNADRTQYRLNMTQTEMICRRMTEPLMAFELSRADVEGILDRMRIELERRIR